MKSRNTFLIFFLALLAGNTIFAQQTLKGTISDQQSDMPLIGATVVVLGTDPALGTVTDIDGYFAISDVPYGRYAVAISYLGYEPITLPNVELTAGKEVILEVGLEESIAQLDEIVVRATVAKDRAQNELATISARTFSVEEVNRYSGGRSDIGRLAANFAGVSTSNDSRNDIVIRGNSPTGVLWRLEGIPIPNPNHFATAGTTGGPVSALNPNMLKNSDFMTSAFPAEYGNALAGVFDLGFRNGNRDKHEFMFQMGAVSGLEGMAEGPLNSKGGSYLVTARYSFLGFAQSINLPIGTNATPDYRDLSFNFNFGNTKTGRWSLFGIGGSSDISFLHDAVDENDLFAANDEDAFAESRFGVVGLKHNLILDDKTYLRTILSASVTGNDFYSERYFDQNTEVERSERVVEANNSELRYSFSSFVNRKFNARLTARAGVLLEQFNYDLLNRTREFTPNWIPVYEFDDHALLAQAYVQTQYRLGQKWTLNTGLHLQGLTLNNNWILEPRLAVNYQMNARQTINVGYGLHSQTAPLPILLEQEELSPGVFANTNQDLLPTRNQHFVLGYDYKISSNWRAKVEAYYQLLDRVAVDATPSSFSILNEGADFTFTEGKAGLVNEGTGTNYGVELTLEKFFSKGYYGLLTASVYDSKYKGSDGLERNTAFNNGYVLNVLAGKEFRREGSRYAFTFDTKFTTAGGRYYTPVDLVASQAVGREIRDESRAFSERFAPYLRWDVKVGMKINSRNGKFAQHFYFDLQNVTNEENVFTRRYNRLTNEVNEVNQLGFFPDFMYRIQF